MRSCLVLVASLVLGLGSARAQEAPAPGGGGLALTKGTIYAGGAIGIAHASQSFDGGGDSAVTTIEFTPTIGYFVTSQLAITASPVFTNVSDDDDSSSSTIGISAGARYHLPLGKLVGYVGGELKLGSASTDTPLGEATMTQMGALLSGGILYAFNAHVALDAGLRASYISVSGDADGSQTAFGIGYLGFLGFF